MNVSKTSELKLELPNNRVNINKEDSLHVLESYNTTPMNDNPSEKHNFQPSVQVENQSHNSLNRLDYGLTDS